ncbi:HAD family hydrolase [Natroniella sulfidigena]|uniref:D-glycero-alpha-D-manno-heptose-1,7-bisphosphate 7-phosphatase n=1 Tax=Natroniella sulfidigena TaxID=723921 RepID=UPI00200B54CF|nr:HAD family hydrolase [Natroniella sulfidigena]MCK8817637.1 HAD family hydrolase [Natroniella sulfidigena]
MTKAVFLDRDGVINRYDQPVNKPTDLILYPWTADSIKKLNQADFKVYIVTNQGGIESGYFTAQDLDEIHQHLINELQQKEATIDDIAYCPHFKSDCECRKPKPGMILNLADKYNIELTDSYLVGDRKSDIIAGNQAGCTTIKLGAKCPEADYSLETLEDAVDIILKIEEEPKN